MVVQQNSTVAPEEFRTLNRCLDNAIADAVNAFSQGHEKKLHSNARSLVDEQRRLIYRAMQTYAAIKIGTVGISGATGKVLDNTLAELLNLNEQARNDMLPAPGTIVPRKGPATK